MFNIYIAQIYMCIWSNVLLQAKVDFAEEENWRTRRRTLAKRNILQFPQYIFQQNSHITVVNKNLNYAG